MSGTFDWDVHEDRVRYWKHLILRAHRHDFVRYVEKEFGAAAADQLVADARQK